MCDEDKKNGGLGCPVVVSVMLEARGDSSAFDRIVPKNDEVPSSKRHMAPYSKVLTHAGEEVSNTHFSHHAELNALPTWF